MINYFREINKTFAYTVFILIACSFAFFGLGGLLSGRSNQSQAKVNGKSISPRVIQQQTQNLLNQYISQTQSRPNKQVTLALQRSALNQLIQQQVALDVAHTLGLQVSQDSVNSIITSNPNLQSKGVFDRSKLQVLLQSLSLSELDLYNQYYQSLLTEHLSEALTKTAFITNKENQRFKGLLSRQFQLQSIEIDRNKVPVKEPNDGELREYFDQHSAQFVSPPSASLRYIKLSAENFIRKAQPSDAAVRDYYQLHLDQYTRPKKVLIKTVSLNDDQNNRYQTISRQNFSNVSALVKALGLPESSLMSAELPPSSALYSSASVGQHFVRPLNKAHELVWIESVTEQHTKPLKEVRTSIFKAVKTEQGLTDYQSTSEQMSDLSYAEAHGLDDTAKKLGLSVERLNYSSNSANEIDASINLADLVSHLRESGVNSNLIQSENSSYVFSLSAYTPEQPLTFEQARKRVRDEVKIQKQALALPDFKNKVIKKMSQTSNAKQATAIASLYQIRVPEKTTLSFDHSMSESVFSAFIHSSKRSWFVYPSNDPSVILLLQKKPINKNEKTSVNLQSVMADVEFSLSFSDWLSLANISVPN